MINSKYFKYTFLFAVLLGFMPTIMFFFKYGYYPTVPLEIMDDTLYYLGRVREVLSGNYFIGNSYLLEHIKDVTTSFFVADWVYSIPFFLVSFLNLPIYAGIVFSEIFWTVATSILLYFLYEELNLEDRYRPIFVTYSVLAVLFYVQRPVAMAVVYPVFIFFLIRYLIWLRDPSSNKNIIYLAVASSFSFYIYTYLWQVVLVVLGLTLLLNVFLKKYIKQSFSLIIYTLLLSGPVFMYTWKQLNSDFYFEALNRVGLMQTHGFGFSALVFGFILVNSLILTYIFYKKSLISKEIYIFFGIISSALLVTIFSNIITGKDLELAVHIGRFVDLFVTFFVGYSFFLILQNRYSLGKIIYVPVFTLFIYSVSLVYSTGFIVQKALPTKNNDYIYSVISFIKTLPKNSVILTSDSLASYVPVMTKNYVLFHPNAELYLVSNFEIEERYLVSRIFTSLSEEQLKFDFRKYSGVGNAVHSANVVNRNAKICSYVKSIISFECSTSITDPYSIKGESYFDRLMVEYINIKKYRNTYIKKYNVDFIIVKKDDLWKIPSDYKLIWKDDSFEVYKVD